MRYEGFRLEKGKYAMEGLPGFYSNEDDTETLVITLKDAAAQVDMELYYSVFEDYDLITRTVRVVNQGTEEIRLCRCASLCLDFLQSDMDFITFNASHLMERCMDRGALRSGIQSVGSVRGISSHQHNPFVILCDRGADEETGICYGAMLLYSGNFEAAVECSQYENSRLIMGIHPYHFCWTLAAGQLVLDFSRKDVRDHIYDQMKKVLSCVEISYLKWDMNRSLTDVWSAALPARFQGEVYHRYVLGIYDLLERLHRDYPHILIEGCCGGGGRFDGGMLYYTP